MAASATRTGGPAHNERGSALMRFARRAATVAAFAGSAWAAVAVAQQTGTGGAGREATQGQTLAPAQPTTPPQPDLQDPKTYLPFVYGPLREEGMTAPAAAPGP